MGSIAAGVNVNVVKPHVVCVPYPAQGHINPMLMLAKLLHQNGFHVTFVNSEFNHRRLLRSRGPHALDGLPDFRFSTIPDGLPPSDADATQDIPALCESTTTTCLEPFCDLLTELNSSDGPPVTCIVADGVMAFTLKAAERFGLPEVLFWTTSACGLLGYTQYRHLVEKGYTPLRDMKEVTNGYLDTIVPGAHDLRLRDFPSFIRTTDPNDYMLNFVIQETSALPRAAGLILNTFSALEQSSLSALEQSFPSLPILPVGPLHLLTKTHPLDPRLDSITSSLWAEHPGCLAWLDGKPPASVVYVNFGSITVVTAEQLTEFAWGLADSGRDFLWVLRPDLVAGKSAMLPAEFLEETKGRGLMVGWCPQEEVVGHPAVGGFLTHSGWNSTIESVTAGVPMTCWPFFAEQQTNCRYSCVEWGVGLEIDGNVKRGEVEKLVKEMMEGGNMNRIRRERALEWKKEAEAAAEVGGASSLNLDKLIKDVLLG